VLQGVVKALLQAGLRFSYEQLMQAVRARTAGVEMWVTATARSTLPYVKGVQPAKWARLPPWIKQLCNGKKVSSSLMHDNFSNLCSASSECVEVGKELTAAPAAEQAWLYLAEKHALL
jgi:hypothetical protein